MNNCGSVNHNDTTTNKEQQDDNKPFFVMTLEFEKGKQEYIKIFPNTDPDEVSFNFCKENNLDFVSMKYLKDEINELLCKFNEKKIIGGIIGSNNSIEEVEEENFLTMKTCEQKQSEIVNEEGGITLSEGNNEHDKEKKKFVYSSLDSKEEGPVDNDVKEEQIDDEVKEEQVVEERNDNDNNISKDSKCDEEDNDECSNTQINLVLNTESKNEQSNYNFKYNTNTTDDNVPDVNYNCSNFYNFSELQIQHQYQQSNIMNTSRSVDTNNHINNTYEQERHISFLLNEKIKEQNGVINHNNDNNNHDNNDNDDNDNDGDVHIESPKSYVSYNSNHSNKQNIIVDNLLHISNDNNSDNSNYHEQSIQPTDNEEIKYNNESNNKIEQIVVEQNSKEEIQYDMVSKTLENNNKEDSKCLLNINTQHECEDEYEQCYPQLKSHNIEKNENIEHVVTSLPEISGLDNEIKQEKELIEKDMEKECTKEMKEIHENIEVNEDQSEISEIQEEDKTESMRKYEHKEINDTINNKQEHNDNKIEDELNISEDNVKSIINKSEHINTSIKENSSDMNVVGDNKLLIEIPHEKVYSVKYNENVEINENNDNEENEEEENEENNDEYIEEENNEENDDDEEENNEENDEEIEENNNEKHNQYNNTENNEDKHNEHNKEEYNEENYEYNIENNEDTDEYNEENDEENNEEENKDNNENYEENEKNIEIDGNDNVNNNLTVVDEYMNNVNGNNDNHNNNENNFKFTELPVQTQPIQTKINKSNSNHINNPINNNDNIPNNNNQHIKQQQLQLKNQNYHSKSKHSSLNNTPLIPPSTKTDNDYNNYNKNKSNNLDTTTNQIHNIPSSHSLINKENSLPPSPHRSFTNPNNINIPNTNRNLNNPIPLVITSTQFQVPYLSSLPKRSININLSKPKPNNKQKLFHYELTTENDISTNNNNNQKNLFSSRSYQFMNIITTPNLTTGRNTNYKYITQRLTKYNLPRSKSANIFEKLYVQAEINRQLPHNHCSCMYRNSNIRDMYNKSSSKKQLLNVVSNTNTNYILTQINTNPNNNKSEMNYGEYLYMRGEIAKEMKRDKMIKYKQQQMQALRKVCKFKPQINENIRINNIIKLNDIINNVKKNSCNKPIQADINKKKPVNNGSTTNRLNNHNSRYMNTTTSFKSKCYENSQQNIKTPMPSSHYNHINSEPNLTTFNKQLNKSTKAQSSQAMPISFKIPYNINNNILSSRKYPTPQHNNIFSTLFDLIDIHKTNSITYNDIITSQLPSHITSLLTRLFHSSTSPLTKSSFITKFIPIYNTLPLSQKSSLTQYLTTTNTNTNTKRPINKPSTPFQPQSNNQSYSFNTNICYGNPIIY